jgi:two-component system chemotaxis sensor kinase CheA
VGRLGGRVTVESRPREGTTIRFILPFTVMMSRVMTVEAGGQVFGIPLDAVVETVRIARDVIHPIGAGKAFVYRNRTIPVIALAHALGQQQVEEVTEFANLVVAITGGELVGIEVDRLGDRLDIMLKPLDGLLAGMRGIAGTTLLGDGRVLIVLDLQEVLD